MRQRILTPCCLDAKSNLPCYLTDKPVVTSTGEQQHIGFTDLMRIAAAYSSTSIVEAIKENKPFMINGVRYFPMLPQAKERT